MTPLCGVIAVISYLLGVASTLLAIRYRERRRRRMPYTPQPDDSRITLFVRRHVVVIALLCLVLDVIVTAAAMILGGIVAVLYHDVKDGQVQIRALQNCQTNYISRVAELSTVRDDALQVVIDDVATRAGEEAFFRDVAKEQAAYKVLRDFRSDRAPRSACEAKR